MQRPKIVTRRKIILYTTQLGCDQIVIFLKEEDLRYIYRG